MTELLFEFQRRLDAHATDKTRRWWEKYLRGAASFRGVRMGDIRAELHTWYKDFELADTLSPLERVALAERLIRQEMTEDKLAGILLLKEIALPGDAPAYPVLLPRFARLFDDGHLADWNSVDWFCVKVLSDLVDRDGPGCAASLWSWADAGVLWRARASLVPFANKAARGDNRFPGLVDGVLGAAERVLVREERFAKTAVGWVLSGLGEAEPDRTKLFIRDNLKLFSLESLRNATGRLDAALASRLLAEFKSLKETP